MGYIRARDIGKAYKRYPHKWGRLAEWLGGGARHQLKWVLKDLTFEIAPGEAVGIIGFNGAGKSTLLKLVAGITRPTMGAVEIGGRVAALLELGVGFHPEFTGRENVRMTAQLSGLEVGEIGARMGEIEAFAGIGDYIDQPLRVYSSGMAMRLAFSVTTAVRPDVLIVDEALAVGDVLFQQKCFDRMRAYREAGTTLLFVSHSMAAVYALCDRAMLIHDGRIAIDGRPREAIDLYNALAIQAQDSDPATLAIAAVPAGVADTPGADAEGRYTTESPTVVNRADTVAERPGTAATGAYAKPGASIASVRLLHQGRPVDAVIGESTIVVEVRVRFDVPFEDPHVGFQVRDARGEAIFMTNTYGMRAPVGPVRPDDEVVVRFEFRASIAPGDYSITAGIANAALVEGGFREALAREHDVRKFTVVRNVDSIAWAGLCNLAPTCTIQRNSTRS